MFIKELTLHISIICIIHDGLTLFFFDKCLKGNDFSRWKLVKVIYLHSYVNNFS